MNILVLCTGNSARSILLEAILTRLGAAQGIRAWSAGSHPARRIHPQALALLAAKAYPTGDLRSKSWDEFAAPDAPPMDIVITVCASAAGETCPLWPDTPIRAHWGVPDPAALPEAAQTAGFQATYDTLAARAKALCALDLVSIDRAKLAAELNRIGAL